MFNITPERIDDVDLMELIDEYSQLTEIFGQARLMLTDVDTAKNRAEDLVRCISALDYFLGGCEMYFRYIEPALMRYYWFEERVKEGQPVE